MKKLIIGFIMGVLFCVSLFEFLHLTIENDTDNICIYLEEKSSEAFGYNFTRSLKLTYKIFARPVKEYYLFVNDEGTVLGVNGKPAPPFRKMDDSFILIKINSPEKGE